MFFEKLVGKAEHVANRSHSECPEDIANISAYITELDSIVNQLIDCEESYLFQSALRSLQFSALSAIQGFYRQSFSELRVFVEHTVAGVYFSYNNLRLRRWLSGDEGLNWARMIKRDRHVLSDEYVAAYCPEMANFRDDLLEDIKAVYSTCSDHVHGRSHVHVSVPSHLVFAKNVFLQYKACMDDAVRYSVLLIATRYLSDMKQSQLRDIEEPVMYFVSDVTSVRNLFE